MINQSIVFRGGITGILFVAAIPYLFIVVSTSAQASFWPDQKDITAPSKPLQIDREGDPDLTTKEKAEVQTFAKHFVNRMIATRDLSPLIKELFFPGFTSLMKQDYYEKVSPDLYRKLTDSERVRLVVAQENLNYFATLDSMAQFHTDEYFRRQAPPFEKVIPRQLTYRLANSPLVEGSVEITDRNNFIRELVRLEYSIARARKILKQRNLEDSPAFRENYTDWIKDEYPLGYRVRVRVLEENLNDRKGRILLKRGEKVFRVETPIFYGLQMIKVGTKLKIIGIEPADGD